jgi:photosystem II stability/assembly factor-like uncharacterized protein/protocatechuate 3,4-dioxygenase beta subunit
MFKPTLRRFLSGILGRSDDLQAAKNRHRSRIRLERLESRDVPSSTIPLQGVSWTPIGPQPLLNGEAPGRPNATGQFASIAVDPTNPNLLFASSSVGGIWTSTNGGNTWTPRTDQFVPAVAPSTTAAVPSNNANEIRVVNRTPADTVYASSSFNGSGFFYLSIDGGVTFNRMDLGATHPFSNRSIAKFLVVPGAVQNQDLIYAAVQSLDMGTSKAGIYRSKDGGATWTNITGAGFPFTPDALTFSDVDVDPTNKEVVYASVNSGPDAGVYRITNAFTTNGTATPAGQAPNWQGKLGAGSGVPFSGFLPTHIQTEVSPALPSTVFTVVSSGNDFIGMYVSNDAGTNWIFSASTSFSPLGTIPDFTLATQGSIALGDFFLNILVDPRSPQNPTQQTLYLGGYGDSDYNVMVSRDSGVTWKHNSKDGFGGDPLDTYARGQDGVGPYEGITDMQLDSNGRLLTSTLGGIFRMNDQFIPSPIPNPVPQHTITWTSLNGTGAGALATTQVAPFGQALSPNSTNQMVINDGGLLSGAGGVVTGGFHSAALFTDNGKTATWKTVDDQGLPFHEWVPPPGLPSFSPTWGTGPVIYDFNFPNIVYREALGGMKRSDDGGQTWHFISLPSPSFPGGLAIDPSDGRLLFSGAFNGATGDDVWFYNSNTDTSATLTSAGFPPLPELAFTGGAPGQITALGVARQNKVIYVATTPGTYAWEDAQVPPFAPRVRLYAIDISGTFGGQDWVELTLPTAISGNVGGTIPPDQINQILVDPTNQYKLYITTASGKVYVQTTAVLNPTLANIPPNPMPMTPTPPPPDQAAVATWTLLNPVASATSTPPTKLVSNATGANVIALDSFVATNPNDDILYLGTNDGVFQYPLAQLAANTFNWSRLGGSELPNNPVEDLDINTSTGIMSAGLDGRGVWQFQIRNDIRAEVFTDVNGNGILDAGDTPLAGVVVQLKDSTNTTIATAVTDAQGMYEFRSVTPGSYTVSEIVPGITVVTTAPVASFTVGVRDVVLGTGTAGPGFQIIPQLNIGNYALGSISGTVFNDTNQNGVRDPGEGGVSGFTIYIDTNNNGMLDAGEPSVVSDVLGNYTFANLGPPVIAGAPNPAYTGLSGIIPPTYNIRQVTLPGWSQTAPVTGFNNVTVTSGQNRINQLFGDFRVGAISGEVFLDANSNSILNIGEGGLQNWTVYIDTNLNGQLDAGEPSTLTDANGFFSFTGLSAGTYRVREVNQSGWVQTTANPPDSVLTGNNSVAGILFGNVTLANFRGINQWTSIGPAPQFNGSGIGNPTVSGRSDGIAVDPTNSNRYFITAASGGVWRTLDGGATWLNVTDNVWKTGAYTVDQSTPFMGAIAMAPSDPNTLYASTGEADTFQYGRGILRTNDGGTTWTLLQGPGNVFDGGWSTRIVVSATDPNTVFMSEFGADPGIWRTTDGGQSWVNITDSSPLVGGGLYFSDVQVNPTNSNIVYAAVGNPNGGPTNGIYRTIDALDPTPLWNLSIGGSALVPGSQPGNIKITLAPSQPSTIYALIGQAIDPNSGSSYYLATYKSSDSGNNWTNLVNAPPIIIAPPGPGQADYDLSLAVNPTNPNVLYIAGQGSGNQQSVGLIAVTNDGGTTWKDALAGTGTKISPHTDIHALAFDKSGRLLVGCDGGVFRLNNATLAAPILTPPFGNVTPQWVSLNGAIGSLNSLATIQFVSIASNPTDPNKLAGGSQDNGTAIYNGNLGWTQTDGGDGSTTVWDFNNPNNLYHWIAPGGPIQKSTDGGQTWAPAQNGINGGSIDPANLVLTMDPSNSNRLFTGTDVVYATDDGAANWKQSTKFSATLDVNIPATPYSNQTPVEVIHAIAVGRSASAGTASYLFVSQGGNALAPAVFRILLNPIPNQPTTADWVNVTPTTAGGISAGLITRLLIDPANPNIMYALEGGTFTTSHIWRTADALDPSPVWTILDGMGAGALPDLPAYTMALDPRSFTDPSDDILYVGNDNGVWSLFNPGGVNLSWSRVGDVNLPVAEVHDLNLNTTTGFLAAGTYGRGVWETRVRGDIKGQVYTDLNGNGVFDAGEPGRPGVTVRLLDATPGPSFGNEIATSVTDANGNYEFPSVRAGNYRVVEVLPANTVQTTANPADFLNFTELSIAAPTYTGSGQPPLTYTVEPRLNFGTYTLASISGVKFDDSNHNGVRDTGEPGIAGFTIYIDANNNGTLDPGEPSVVTAADGSYTFSNLGPAVVLGVPVTGPTSPYIIREVQQFGWTQSSPAAGFYSVTVTSGAAIIGKDFGNSRVGAIRGQKFLDINSNGRLETGEPGLANWQFYIDTNLDGQYEVGEPTTTTDANGFFTFTGLAAGTYRVREVQQPGYIQTTANPPDVVLTGTNSVSGLLFGNVLISNFRIINGWTPIGPAPQLNGSGTGNPSVSGHVADIAVAPSTTPGGPDRYFATPESGGVWRSLNAGQTWTPVTDNIPGLSLTQSTPFVSAIAVAASNPNTVYAESDTGLLKTTDGGDHWTLLQSAGGGYSARIVVDSTDQNTLVMALGSLVERSTDGGVTWTDITSSSPVFSFGPTFSDVQMDPTNPNVVYAAAGNPAGDALNGIYRTSNALSANPSWTLQIGGSAFVPGTLPGNIRLSISHSQPSTLYAALAKAIDPNTGKSYYLATYKTTDSGVNWTNLVNAPDYMSEQGDYDLAIQVSPTNPNVVFAAGDGVGPDQNTQLVVVSNDGGLTWRDAIAGSGAVLGPHTDVHALAFDNSGRLLLGSDGGMFRLNNATLPPPTFAPPFGGAIPNWVSLNGALNQPGGLNTIEFIGIATHPTDPNQVIGGSQDNGVALYQGNVAWNSILGGDAGQTLWDFDRPQNLYRIAPVSSVGAANYIMKSSDGGQTWVPAAVGTGATPGNTLFYPPFIMDPGNSQRLFTGTDYLLATDDGAATWAQQTKYSQTLNVTIPATQVNFGPGIPPIPLSGQNPPIPIEAVAVGRSSFQFLYVSQGGFMLRIFLHNPIPMQPTSMEWVNVTPPGSIDITKIIVDPANPDVVYALDSAGTDRVYRSADMGATWTVLDGMGSGALPPVGARSIALDPRTFTDPNDDILYVGTNNGVFGLVNPNGTNYSWFRVGDQNLPAVAVSDLNLNTTTGILAAGTYGRGVWETRIRGDIKGQVFEDLNGNGVFDAGEPIQAGVTVRVLDATPGPSFGAELATTTTNALGFYDFPSLRVGNYQIVEVPPTGELQTTANPPAFLNFTEESTALASFNGTPPVGIIIEPRLTFGNFRTGTISGVKFDDRNNNGIRDAGEPGLGGFVIFSDLHGTGILTPDDPQTTTAADGSWTLTGFGPPVLMGVPTNPPPFIIREVQQPNFTQTSTNPAGISLVSGQTVTGVNFGNMRNGRISGAIFNDLNGNGIHDSGDPGVPNVTMNLVDTSTGSIVRTIQSDSSGNYIFYSLSAGTYQVREVVPTGWIQTKPVAPNPTFYTVTITASGQLGGFEFGNFKLFTVSGVKFEDLNGDGTRQSGEPGVPGFTIRLTNTGTGVVTNAVTDAFGNFSFPNIGPGNYTIAEVQKPGWTQTSATPAGFQGISGTDRTGRNFGNFRLITVTGNVFNDANGNGVRDPGEPGIGGITVQLDIGSNGTIDATTQTDANGNYSFPTLGPGSYTISQARRKGFIVTTPPGGSYSFTAVSSTNPTGLNFGDRSGAIIAVGEDAGNVPLVSVRSPLTNQQLFSFLAYAPGFQGGVRVATGYISNQTVPDIVTAAGPGGGPHVRVFNGQTGQEEWGFFAYDASFTGGVYVAVGDVNGDGVDDIITGADQGGGPHVKVFDGATHQQIYSFFAYDSRFTGGVRVAAADVNGDGYADIITGAGPGGGPHVKVFSGHDLSVLQSFFAFDASFHGGVYVAGGDFNQDGKADIAVGAGAGGGPHVRIFDGQSLAIIAESFVFDQSFHGGVRVAAMDVNFDNHIDLIVGPGPGMQPNVSDYSIGNGFFQPISTFSAFDPTFLGGVFVG